MSVFYVTLAQSIQVSGKTYPYREVLRNLGGQYQAQDKSWVLPLNDEILGKIDELCRTIGGGPQKTARTPAPARAPAATIVNEVLVADPGFEPAVPKHDGLTIAELMQQVQLAIAQSFPRSVWVVGEIQNFRQTATGSYFQLADFKEGASRSATMTVNATIWRSQWMDMERKLGRDALKELMADGLRVRMLVDVALFKDRGQISLQVQAIDPSFTKGSLALAREKLLRELRSKGLDQKNKALPWPNFPLRIGLISADDSRAKSDFLDQLLVYGYPGIVRFFPAQMQGENTLRDVVNGIQTLEKQDCDLIVITRGGGSAADLRWFDAPEIAYAIAGARVPIVAAIGHHEDVCVAEEISARREKTPTAAADFCVHLLQKTKERLDQLSQGLGRSLDERVRLYRQLLQNLREKLLLGTRHVAQQHSAHLATMRNELQARSERILLQKEHQLERLAQETRSRALQVILPRSYAVESLAQRLSQAAREALQKKIYLNASQAQQLSLVAREGLQTQRERLFHLEKSLEKSDPTPWMAQGWTQLFADGKKIDGADQLTTGMHLRARLRDALLELKLEALTKKERNPT